LLSPNKVVHQEALTELLGAGDWDNPIWRLNNLYKGRDEEGKAFDFVMNEQQHELMANLWYRNDIVKCRQVGFTTFILLLATDQCIFTMNYTATVIAQTLPNVAKLFADKVLWVIDNLPAGLKEYVHANIKTRNTDEIKFSWGSSIYAGLSPRGGTNQLLHISEFAKICAKNPEKAKEIVTGGFGSVHQTGFIFIESTSEGQQGPFYDISQDAYIAQQEKRKLARLEFRLHFFPWWQKKSYCLPEDEAKTVAINSNQEDYFDGLAVHGVPALTKGQMAWYVLQEKSFGSDMKREHPSYFKEAFEVAIKGAIYEKQMTALYSQNRIGNVPWDPTMPVNTFWDFGVGDDTAIWFHQRNGLSHQFFKCYVNSGHGMAHYWQYITELGLTLGKHYLPHDAEARMMGEAVMTKRKILENLGMKNIKVVTRIPRRKTGIEMLRMRMPMMWVDRLNCADGLAALNAYQWEWDKTHGRWKDDPYHNWASNACDALRVWGEGYEFSAPGNKPLSRASTSNWRTA
jgi:hypothetical protein